MRTKLDAETDFVYEHSCPTCRLFGSTGFIGRIAIGDAYLVSESATEQRDGVGIDRFTGGASHSAKFELEVVSSNVVFETKIHLRNFEIWQLGMLFVVLQDLEDEIDPYRIRSLTRTGQSHSANQSQGRHNQPGGFVTSTIRNSAEPAGELWGLGRWLVDGSYGTWHDDLITLTEPLERHKNGIRVQRSFQDQKLAALREACIDNFVARMQHWPDNGLEQVLAGVQSEKQGR